MDFSGPLVEGRLIRRYQRFLVDVRIGDEVVTAHCPNTGSMLGCVEPGSSVWLSASGNPRRRCALTWELVAVAGGTVVGINTSRSNALVAEAIRGGLIPEFSGFGQIRGEVRYGKESSRIDLLLTAGDGSQCYVEVKNVTAAVADGIALFPDAVSTRATKHLRELMAMVRDGHRAAVCFCAQRGDVREVRPADAIDPEYGRTLRQALAAGVEAIALRAEVSPRAIRLCERVPVVCP
jgi:sugar fermentation stimulation protein A